MLLLEEYEGARQASASRMQETTQQALMSSQCSVHNLTYSVVDDQCLYRSEPTESARKSLGYYHWQVLSSRRRA